VSSIQISKIYWEEFLLTPLHCCVLLHMEDASPSLFPAPTENVWPKQTTTAESAVYYGSLTVAPV